MIALVSSLAKEIEDSSIVDTGKACSIGESRECKYSYYTSATTADRVHAKHDPYAIEVDCGWNCYSCGDFGYITRNYRNWKIIG